MWTCSLPMMPAIDERLTINPPPLATMAPKNTPVAGAIIKQRTGTFDPSTYQDRYQEALRELIEAKMKGVAIKRRAVSVPPPVIDLMAAFETQPSEGSACKWRQSDQREADQDNTRSPPAVIAVTGVRWSKEEGTARRRADHDC
jgi:hypothetical protein